MELKVCYNIQEKVALPDAIILCMGVRTSEVSFALSLIPSGDSEFLNFLSSSPKLSKRSCSERSVSDSPGNV